MDVDKILEYFKENRYIEVKMLLEKEIEKDSDNPDNYYYLFLASNDDYCSIDYDNLSNELYFNKALELASRRKRNQYESEFNFYKCLTPKARELFYYACREKWDLFSKELDDLKSFKLCSNTDDIILFIEDMRNVLMKYDSLISSVLNYYLLNVCYLKINEKYILNTMKFLENEKEFGQYLDISIKGSLDDIKNSIGNNKSIIFAKDSTRIGEYKGIYKYDIDKLEITSAIDKEIQELIIPNQIKGIGKCAFASCTNLKHIEIPNSVTYIGDYAFCNCYNLDDFKIPNSVTSIGKSAFANCINLSNIEIPKSITNIGEFVFSDCNRLHNIFYGGDKNDFKKSNIKNVLYKISKINIFVFDKEKKEYKKIK